MVSELSSKIEVIENEMDIRVESLISSIHNYRDECNTKSNVSKKSPKGNNEIILSYVLMIYLISRLKNSQIQH